MSHRTQIYLTDIQYKFLSDWAQKTKKSMAELIREFIDHQRHKALSHTENTDALFSLRGLFKESEPNVAQNFDDYLYGDKK